MSTCWRPLVCPLHDNSEESPKMILNIFYLKLLHSVMISWLCHQTMLVDVSITVENLGFVQWLMLMAIAEMHDSS